MKHIISKTILLFTFLVTALNVSAADSYNEYEHQKSSGKKRYDKDKRAKAERIAHTKNDPWAYLKTPAFQKRSATVAEYMHDCDVIINIGGAGDVINQHIEKSQQLITIDLALRTHHLDNCIYEGKRFEQWREGDSLKGKKYGIVLLGYAMTLQEDQRTRLIHLINNAHKAVIEYSVCYKVATRAVPTILDATTKAIVKDEHTEYAAEATGAPLNTTSRRMIFLEDQK